MTTLTGDLIVTCVLPDKHEQQRTEMSKQKHFSMTNIQPITAEEDIMLVFLVFDSQKSFQGGWHSLRVNLLLIEKRQIIHSQCGQSTKKKIALDPGFCSNADFIRVIYLQNFQQSKDVKNIKV